MRNPIHEYERPRRGCSITPRAPIVVLVLTAVLSFLHAQGAESNSRLSLRISGGAGLLGWGDVEALRDSHSRQIQFAAAQWGIETTGASANPRIGWQAEVELRVDLSHRFSLGFSYGLNRRSGESVLQADWPPLFTSRHIWNQDASLTTAGLNAYWNLPLNSRSAAYITAGAGLGSAVWKYKIRDEELIDIVSWEQIEGTARDSGPLLQAGIGFEFRVFRRWLVFVETRGQLLSLAGWKAEHSKSTDAGPTAAIHSDKQALWLAEIAASGEQPARQILLASQFNPDQRFYDGVRALRLNFSGVVFQAGFRWAFGSRPGASEVR